MKAIRVRYLPATTTRGARLKADDGDGNSLTTSHHCNAGDAEGRRAVALALCEKMQWTGLSKLYGVHAGDYYFVFEDSAAR